MTLTPGSETVATIADLTSIPKDGWGTGQQVTVLYYSTVNDGGGGAFYWELGSTTTPDGGTVFAPDEGGDGRWKRASNSAEFNLKWFGAVGDGSADDTAALTAFLSALGSGYYDDTLVGPRMGFVPAGKYKHTLMLTIPVWSTVYGVPGCSVLQPTSAVSVAVVQEAASNLWGITIHGVNAGSNKTGLSIGASGEAISGSTRDVVCTGFLGDTSGFGLDMGQAVVWELRNCTFDGNGFGAKLADPSSGGAPTNTVFDHCRFKSNGRRGLWMVTGTGVKFTICDFENNGEDGAYVNDGGVGTRLLDSVTFDDCHFESNQLDAASGATRHALFHMTIRGHNVRVKDSYFVGDANSCRAIKCESSRGTLISGVVVRNEAGQINIDASCNGTLITDWATDTNGARATTITNSAGGQTLAHDTVAL